MNIKFAKHQLTSSVTLIKQIELSIINMETVAEGGPSIVDFAKLHNKLMSAANELGISTNKIIACASNISQNNNLKRNVRKRV